MNEWYVTALDNERFELSEHVLLSHTQNNKATQMNIKDPADVCVCVHVWACRPPVIVSLTLDFMDSAREDETAAAAQQMAK